MVSRLVSVLLVVSKAFVIHSLVLLITALSLTGCFFGRSKIVVSDGGNYDIYANDQYVCSTKKSDCSLQQRGTSDPVRLEAVKDGTVYGETTTSRSITVASILWAPFTYYSSLFLYKAYPDEIYIYVGDRDRHKEGGVERYKNSDGEWKTEENTSGSSSGSVWDKPLFE